MLGAKVSLAAIFVATFFVLCWVNLYIADRLAPPFPPAGPEQEVLDRFRDAIGQRTGLFRVGRRVRARPHRRRRHEPGVAVMVAVRQRRHWGSTDAQFDTDLGFYMFQLPFLSSVADWAFASILIVLVVTIAAHFANGGIRVQPVGPGAVGPAVTSQVKAHISVLLGLLALIRAGGYYLQRFELTTSTRGVVDGASYTDVNAQLPVLNLLVLISVAIVRAVHRQHLAAGLGAADPRRRPVGPGRGRGRRHLPPGDPALPGGAQRVVEGGGLHRAQHRRHPRGARPAIGVDHRLRPEPKWRQRRPHRQRGTSVRNIRLWDPSPTVLGQTFPRLEQLLPYYRLNDVDVDRYDINGELTQVVLSARDLDTSGIPNKSWEAKHVIYTHGYGVVMASGTSKTAQGRPDFFLQQVPVKENTDLELRAPQIYFGENLSGYVITGATRDELDFQVGDDHRAHVLRRRRRRRHRHRCSAASPSPCASASTTR